ncbi:MAG: ABC transporter permease, partial [Duncaniella sp.]|nr:ABC transporter permease [Duncaniella sp.]
MFSASLKRGIRSLGTRKIYFFMMIVVPVVCSFFFLNLMYEGLPLKVPVAIVDNDQSSMSRNVTRQL